MIDSRVNHLNKVGQLIVSLYRPTHAEEYVHTYQF